MNTLGQTPPNQVFIFFKEFDPTSSAKKININKGESGLFSEHCLFSGTSHTSPSFRHKANQDSASDIQLFKFTKMGTLSYQNNVMSWIL